MTRHLKIDRLEDKTPVFECSIEVKEEKEEEQRPASQPARQTDSQHYSESE
jgi:hypothetical protein